MKEQIEAVQSMQNYIESRWQESITLAVLSEVSHFSPWYSTRPYRWFRQPWNVTTCRSSAWPLTLKIPGFSRNPPILRRLPILKKF